MPPARNKKPPTTNEFLASFANNLRIAARNPNIDQYAPHKKQLQFHSSTDKGRLFIGGNRSGKTVGGICEDVWWLTGTHPYITTPRPPIKGRIVCVDFSYGIEKIIRPKLAQWLPVSQLKGGSWDTGYSKELKTLTLENGSTVELMSYEQSAEKFAGTDRDFIHFDEEPPKDIFDECSARLIDRAGKYWVTMTPLNGMTWIYDSIYMPGKENADSNIKVVEAEMAENPYISPVEVQSYLAGLDKDDREARGKGKFVQIGGLVYKTFNDDDHIIPPFTPPVDWEWYVSMDHGFNNPTCWLWHAVSPNGDVVTFDELYDREKTVDYWAKAVHAKNQAYGNLPFIYVGDPAIAQRQGVTGVSIQGEYAERGIGIILGVNDVLPGINRINSYLALRESDHCPTWRITANCINLIREMKRLRWRTWHSNKLARQNNAYDAIHKKDDHAPDAARYFFSVRPDLTPDVLVDAVILPFTSTAIQADSSKFDTNLKKDTKWKIEYIDQDLGGDF